jgi:hypothetical protein
MIYVLKLEDEYWLIIETNDFNTRCHEIVTKEIVRAHPIMWIHETTDATLQSVVDRYINNYGKDLVKW